MNVVFCGYRSWAQEVVDSVAGHPGINVLDIIKNRQEWEEKSELLGEADTFLFLGWSWLIPDDFVRAHRCLGIHPSDLPWYRGGSPIQHQIIDGITHTKITLMSLAAGGIDTGDIWGKEDVDFTGDSMDEIFRHIAESSIKLLNRFFDHYPDIKPVPQRKDEGSCLKRRKPSDSGIRLQQVTDMKLKELYDFIRALTDPYPNAYLYDEEGNRLIIKGVQYVEGSQDKPE